MKNETNIETIEQLASQGKTYIEPPVNKVINSAERSCLNCMDQIVCYGFDEPTNPEKGKTCQDWQIDFMIFQDMIEKKERK